MPAESCIWGEHVGGNGKERHGVGLQIRWLQCRGGIHGGNGGTVKEGIPERHVIG